MVYIATVVYCSDVYVCVWRHCRYFYRRASPAIVLYGGVAVLELFCRVYESLFGYVQCQSECFRKSVFPAVDCSVVYCGVQFGENGYPVYTVSFIYLYCVLDGGATDVNSYSINEYACLFPLLVLMLAGLGLGFGLLISSLTTKYRDLRFLVTFGVQLWMYATPVIYPLSVMQQSHEKYMWLIIANPLTSIIETFKYGFLGEGIFSWWYLGYSFLFTVLIVVWGMITFNKVQRSFMDVI